MDRTVARRSEPSPRTAFRGEQPNPWDVLPPQDAMSRHRGAKPPRRYELLGEISPGVMESSASRIFDQAENRLHAQQALLAALMGGL